MEGVSLVTKSGMCMYLVLFPLLIILFAGAGNPYVKLSYDKQRAKTDSVKQSEDPTWKELFLLYDTFHNLVAWFNPLR